MQYRYLIIGGGMTGDSAVRGIREVDERGSIGMISAESHHPYNRPPLTKGLWKGQPEEQIWRDPTKLGHVSWAGPGSPHFRSACTGRRSWSWPFW